jgi:predicted DCC family thiol-disulfide oxidoreductase YuxK
MNAQDLVAQHSRIILFDGVCNLCAAWVQFVVKRDPQGQFKFASVQSPQGQALLAWCGLPVTQFETMVYIHNGQASFKTTAFFHIVRQFNRAWLVFAKVSQFMPLVIKDWLYDRIALNRYRLFGQRNVCLMPSAQLMSRFLW